LIYTRDILGKFDLKLEGFNETPLSVNDINVLLNDVLKPQADAKTTRDDYLWNIAQYELLDSLNNETLFMVRRVKLFEAVKTSQQEFSNGWD